MRWSVLLALATVTLVATSVFATSGSFAHFRGPSGVPLAAPRPDLRPSANASINDVVNVNVTSPVGTFAPGSVIQVYYRVSITTVPVTSSATVYIPGMIAAFPAVPAPVQLFLPPHNLTMASGGTGTAPPSSFSLRNSTSFSGSRLANLNSELVSVMSSVPFGSSSVVVQWNWTMRTGAGAYTTSGWGPANGTPIHPAEVAFLQSLDPRSVVPPATVTECLNGPIQGRTFSFHAETAKPSEEFVENTSSDPVGGPSTFCQSVVIPTSITPQTILIQIWDYESVTLLLYTLKVKVVNASSGPPPALATSGWTTIANAGLVVGAVALAGLVALAVRREPRDGAAAPASGRAAEADTPTSRPGAAPSPPADGGDGAARSRR